MRVLCPFLPIYLSLFSLTHFLSPSLFSISLFLTISLFLLHVHVSLSSYIFYADKYCCVWRANSDGTNPEKIISGSTEISDIAIDITNSTLYWTDSGIIYQSGFNGQNKQQINTNINGSPIGLSVNNSTLYWSSMDGSIISYSLNGGETRSVIEQSTLHPQDISTFISKSIIQSGNLYTHVALEFILN